MDTVINNNFNQVFEADVYNKVAVFVEDLKQVLVKHNIKEITGLTESAVIKVSDGKVLIDGMDFK